MEFSLRDWEIGDIQSVAEYANNKNVARYLRNVFSNPYTLEDARDYIQSCINGDAAAALCKAIVAEGRAVGSIGVFRKDDVYQKSAELGYWLAQPYWGKGIMTRAVGLLCDMAFEQWDIVRIFAEPYAVNKGSRRVLEKNGFELEGVLKNSVYKYGELMDSCMYAKLR